MSCFEQGMVPHGTWCMDLVLLMVWKGTSCMDWDHGWIGKVPGVRYSLWIVLLKSAKDWLERLDTRGQQVLPHV
jgi:hypothetical protein